ncbi:uncharacterized protein TrAtP1_004670 [Trichoderma atroviride]|uniref:uncharacterized protein n=1 Tax=Hypocrea atroviridis TaxID=63577 RepID=UPI003327E340|nr:hypothetical protein TrAtP1_004670 [Trichoderma atroviride]
MIIFNSNCTIPRGVVPFVAAPYIRGTLDIIWGCCSILLICTWSILHMNLPLQSTLSPNSRKQKYRRASLRLLTKAKWMLLNILAPEWPLGKAWSDSMSVKLVKDRFEKLRKEDKVPWSTTHIYFANMGGFGIKFSPANADSNTESVLTTDATPQVLPNSTPPLKRSACASESPVLPPTRQSSVTHDGVALHDQTPGIVERIPTDTYPLEPIEISNGTDRGRDQGRDQFDYIRGKLDGLLRRDKLSTDVLQRAMPRQIGEVDWHVDERNRDTAAQALDILEWNQFRDPWEQTRFLISWDNWFYNLRALQGDLWILDANQLLLAREIGIIDRLPAVTEDDLGDRNKGDAFVKMVALVQIGWFLFNLITRLYQRLPTSQLEIMTLSFAICSGITYMLLIHKPKDVSYTITMPASRYPEASELIRLALLGPFTMGPLRRTVWIPNNAVHIDHRGKLSTRASRANLLSASAFALVVFGCTHCIAWNFAFPTEAEQMLWRVSSILTASAIPTLSAVNYLVARLINTLRPNSEGIRARIPCELWVQWILGGGIGVAFLAARAFIIFEVFRCLAFQQPETFLTSWPANIPHVS